MHTNHLDPKHTGDQLSSVWRATDRLGLITTSKVKVDKRLDGGLYSVLVAERNFGAVFEQLVTTNFNSVSASTGLFSLTKHSPC